MSQYLVGLIGCGRKGTQHARAYQIITALPLEWFR